MIKSEKIKFRVYPKIKSKWKKKAEGEKSSLSEFIRSRVEDDSTFREIDEIEKIGNTIIDYKSIVGNNINQISKDINTDKLVSDRQLNVFYKQMELYREEMRVRNSKLQKIYNLLYQKLTCFLISRKPV